MPDGVGAGVDKHHPRLWVAPHQGRVCPQHHALALGGVELCCTRTAKGHHGALQQDPNVRCCFRVQTGVVCMLLAAWGCCAVGHADAADAAVCLQLPAPGRQRLRCYDVQQRAEGAALCAARGDVKHPAAVTAVEQDLAARALQQQADPPRAALREVHGLHALQQPVPVKAVVRLLEVEEDDAALLPAAGCLLQVVNLLKVQQHVVGDVPPRHEGRLRAVYNAVYGWAKPEHDDLSHDLQVAVQQRDGPVATGIGPGLATPLVDEENEPQPLLC